MRTVRWRRRHGGALVIVVISGVVFAVVAAGVLAMSLAGSQSAGNREARLRARFAAESALVIAYQKLWNEATLPYPPGCPEGTTGTFTESVDTDGGSGPLPPTSVKVTVTNCGACTPTHPTCEHQVTAKVSY